MNILEGFTFTRQDFLTFFFGLVAVLAVAIVASFNELQSGEIDTVAEFQEWGIALGAALGTALIRYLGTYVPQWWAARAARKAG